MTHEEYRLALLALTGGFSVVWGLGYLAYVWIKSRSQRSLPGEVGRELREQLSQLQVSVDAMSVEIERISEAQRFTTKVLTERSDPARLERGRLTT